MQTSFIFLLVSFSNYIFCTRPNAMYGIWGPVSHLPELCFCQHCQLFCQLIKLFTVLLVLQKPFFDNKLSSGKTKTAQFHINSLVKTRQCKFICLKKMAKKKCYTKERFLKILEILYHIFEQIDRFYLSKVTHDRQSFNLSRKLLEPNLSNLAQV